MLDSLHPQRGFNGIYCLAPSRLRERRQPTRGLDVTLLSFQRPGRGRRATKNLRLAPEAFRTEPERSYPLTRRRSVRRVTGLPAAPLSGGLPMVAHFLRRRPAPSWGRRSPSEAHETALSGLQEGVLQSSPRKVEVAHGLAIELDAALRDQAPRLARREREARG